MLTNEDGLEGPSEPRNRPSSKTRAAVRTSRPIVFVGPSLPHAEASKILTADYRPPIRRGDLDGLVRGDVVAIIDGVFEESLSVSPREIREAALQGVRILGSSSMGALRAAEVREMEGVGRIQAMFADETIDSDDEVALVFDPETLRPLSEPLVNIRYAIERLQRPGTIDASLGAKLLRVAKRLFYAERTYARILHEAGIRDVTARKQLETMLSIHDLKREDAITLLEQLSRETRGLARTRAVAPARDDAGPKQPAKKTHYGDRHVDTLGEIEADETMPVDAPVLFFEYGDSIPFRDLLRFLKLTGAFAAHARSAVGRYALHGNEVAGDEHFDPVPAIDHEVVAQRVHWGWWAAEESRATLRDIGLGFADLLGCIEEEVTARYRVMELAREESDDFLRALRAELFLSDLSLKRAAIRYGSILRLADEARASGPPDPAELAAAKAKLAEPYGFVDWSKLLGIQAQWGVTAAECEEFAILLALARRTAGRLVDAMAGRSTAERRRQHEKGDRHLVLRKSPKVDGDPRFCVGRREALRRASALRSVVGVTRVSVITGLSPLGIPNAQAYRPDGQWSSTIGSGKSTTADGARIGAIMEEVEKWAQERFGETGPDVVASYEDLAKRERVVDPRRLALPFDSTYDPSVPIGWRRCHDLLSGGTSFVPLTAWVYARQPDDPLYSPRVATRMFDSNGLASGFTLEEALTHGLCEVIERHATKIADMRIYNPGFDPSAYRFVDPETMPPSAKRLVRRIQNCGSPVHVIDITGEIRVPTFWAMIHHSRGSDPARGRASGWAAHPDPEVALSMAILEATQTILTNVAGGREDLAIRSRSLGRQERTLAQSQAGMSMMKETMTDRPYASFSEVRGFVSRDARDDVEWILERLRDAGVEEAFAVDLTRPEILPARVIRVVTPGLDTPNPLHTGLRARLASLRDLMPLRGPKRS